VSQATDELDRYFATYVRAGEEPEGVYVKYGAALSMIVHLLRGGDDARIQRELFEAWKGQP
jgi:hypothetical protein